MSSVKSITLGLVISGFAVAGCAHSGPHASPTAKADNGVLKACIFRTADEVAKSPACNDQFTKAGITSDDVRAIKTCKAMSTSAMKADTTCQTQMSKHPGAF